MIQPINTYLRPTDTLEDAARVMLETRFDVLPVGDEQGRLVGVFSRSSLYRMILEKLPSHTSIEGFVKTDAVTTPLERLDHITFEELERVIQNSRVGSSIIIDRDRRIIGVLTKSKVVNALVESKNDLREQLEAILQTDAWEPAPRREYAARFQEKTQGKSDHLATYQWEHILTRDKAMKQLIISAQKAARRDTSVLLRGESGTGKELFAHAIHNASKRSAGPFVTINCASVPEHLLEAEFFGYENGAFTGADRSGRMGKLELAHGGTLFLDEIGDMALHLQAKLLRVIEGKEFYRVGGTKPIHADIRIISATNAPLEEMIAQKAFREDLYYRLHVMTLSIPPLRARANDILLVANAFIKQLNPVLETSVTGIEESVQKVLYQYEWPGNIRQLRNVIERALILAENGKISFADLPEELLGRATVLHGKTIVQAAEKTEIERALRETHGNKVKAARLLGMSRSVLYEKLKKFNL
ncbi:sigma 54-interacting transcriptional regulator [Brevibacillus choshinensis]|uniref:Sigma 54-interacting transcriptional regulator n=2 Tax=Brevibacillus choshinensis TaxID=54911 RepID=A0ABX7FXS4_BRECH|nr:sigma 54-interacting transcriptional regulator [Brevibacillus choshinensis]